MQIVLMGYMTSGKSAIGQKLATILNQEFIDLDDFIEDKEGRSISEIFKKKGEIYFRKKEADYLKTILNEKNNMVLALGGGTPCYGDNLKRMQQADAHLIYLKASIPLIVNRLQAEKSKRPLVAQLKTEEQLTQFVGKHLFERSAFYSQGDQIVDVDGRSINELVEQIILPLF